jgi:Putative MetA-pathway of phenol degradation
MIRHRTDRLTVIALVAALSGGCASVSHSEVARGQSPEIGGGPRSDTEQKAPEENGKDKKDEPEGPPKTLFEWAIGPKEEKKAEEEQPDSIVTDRPDFTEASSTVGLGRVQLEAGYTYFRDRSGGSTQVVQTFPEALLRIGLFAEWFELRLGQTYVHSRTTAFGETTEHLSGLSDTYVGVKLWLTEQKCHLPETAIIFQALLPTAGQLITSDRVLPGFNYLYGWDIIPDFLSAGGSLGVNSLVDDAGHTFVVVNQSFTIGYQLTEQLGAYTEWFALYPSSAIAPDVGPEHYFNGGFTFKVTPDFQLDIRAGVGLNRHAVDFFTGAGFAVRY